MKGDFYDPIVPKDQLAFDAAVAKGHRVKVSDGYWTASGSAQVTASGSAQVTASGSAQVTASGSAQVRASGSAQVTAYDSAQVRASKFVAVTVNGGRVKVIEGTHVIQVPEIKTVEEWCEYHDVNISRGSAIVYKAVDSNYESAKALPNGKRPVYAPKAKVEAPDWSPGPYCGQGLHFSPRPHDALAYAPNATKFVACRIKVADAVLIGDKLKAPRCTVIHECTIDGEEIKAP